MALLINGSLYDVPGVPVIGPHQESWSFLSAGDGIARTLWPGQVVLHKTLADDPEIVRPGKGPEGRAHRTAQNWLDDPNHSGAQCVVDSHLIACLADLVRFEAWHARAANLRSIGIEMSEERGGIVYQATLDNTVSLCGTIAERVGIQGCMPKLDTHLPLERYRDGGSTLFGFFGHRCVDTTRNKWDPGDEIYRLLAARLGFVFLDYTRRPDGGSEDRDYWKDIQADLVRAGHKELVIDGLPGPATTAALRAEGYRGGCYALGKG